MHSQNRLVFVILIFLTIGAVGVVIEQVIPGTEAERAGLEGIDFAFPSRALYLATTIITSSS